MYDMNQVTIMGRLVCSPDFRRGKSGGAFSTFVIAVNRRWKDEAGSAREESAFVPAIIFGTAAEWVAEHQKGETVILTGRLRTETWEANGATCSRLVLVVEHQQFVKPVFGSRTRGDGGKLVDEPSGEVVPVPQQKPPF